MDFVWIFGTGKKGLKKSTRYPRQLRNKNPHRFFAGIHARIRAAKSKIHAGPPQASSLCACLFQECVLKLSGSRTPGKCPQLGTGRAIKIFWAKKIHEKKSSALVLVAPYCAIPRDYLSDTPLLRAMGLLMSQHGQLGAIPPPAFLSISPLESMRSGGAIPPLKRGISAILARYPMKTRQMGAIPPSAILSRKGIARYGGVSRTGPLRRWCGAKKRFCRGPSPSNFPSPWKGPFWIKRIQTYVRWWASLAEAPKNPRNSQSR